MRHREYSVVGCLCDKGAKRPYFRDTLPFSLSSLSTPVSVSIYAREASVEEGVSDKGAKRPYVRDTLRVVPVVQSPDRGLVVIIGLRLVP